MAHPDLSTGVYAFEEEVVGIDFGEACAAVFTSWGGLDVSAEGVGHELGAVAYAEQGVCSGKAGDVDAECVFVVNAQRASGEDYADDAFFVAEGEFVVGDNLAVDVQFADAPGYELGCLGSEIKDYDLFLHII